jgi:hypothetical protein
MFPSFVTVKFSNFQQLLYVCSVFFLGIFQINLAVDFGFDDDVVIERLREVMHELRSQRLDHPGRSPNDELPQKPFGFIPTSLTEFKPPPIEKELGLRSGFSDKERKYSEYTIMKQNETERAIKEERHLTVDDEGAFDDEGSFELSRPALKLNGNDYITFYVIASMF